MEFNSSFFQLLTSETPRTPRVVRTLQITRSAGYTITLSEKQ